MDKSLLELPYYVRQLNISNDKHKLFYLKPPVFHQRMKYVLCVSYLLHFVFGIVLINSVHYYRSFITERVISIQSVNDIEIPISNLELSSKSHVNCFGYNFKTFLSIYNWIETVHILRHLFIQDKLVKKWVFCHSMLSKVH